MHEDIIQFRKNLLSKRIHKTKKNIYEISFIEDLLEYGKLFQAGKNPTPPNIDNYSISNLNDEDIIIKESEVLGTWITLNPFNSYREKINKWRNALLIDRNKDSENVVLVIFLNNFKEKLTRRGKRYLEISISDESDSCKTVIFEELYKENKNILEKKHILMIIADFKDGYIKIKRMKKIEDI
jgi:DNA polymerase III alpha subunit